MYTQSARFYDALYHFKDYAAASTQLLTLLQQHNPNAETLLDVACGTGKHLEYLREHYQVEGLDLNPEMLEVARGRCPDVSFHQGNMVTFGLGRRFDVVTCLFSAIGYVKTVDNLKRTVANMASHLRPGGIVVIEPWFTPESYWVDELTANFVDEPELKIAWMYISEVEDRTSVLKIHYLVGTSQGIRCFEERHEMGLFSHEECLEAFRRAGLEVHYDPEGLFGRGMYLGRNPRSGDE
jgi:ubiquinone/menaquinone biosynthesis C-methylase UbiE